MDKNKIMMIIIIALLVVLLGSIIGVFFMFRSYVNTNAVPEEEIVAELPEVKYQDLTLVSIPSISTNLATGEDGLTHTAKVELAYSVVTTEEESADMIALLAEKEKVIQSIVLETIRSKTYEEMMRTDTQQQLEDEILKKLQDAFETNLIYSVFIYDIIAV